MAHKTKLEILRESERLLSAELTRLRQRIKAAEAGENKRIRNTVKYIAKTNREIARASKLQAQMQEQELERLEKFLGESFENIYEARQAIATQTRKATKKELLSEAARIRAKEPKSKSLKQRKRLEQEATRYEREALGKRLSPTKAKYSIRKLSEMEQQRVLDFLSDKHTFNQLGEGYLQPGEVITVSVPYQYRGGDGRIHTARSTGKKVYTSWDAFYAYINTYNDGLAESEDWLGDIEVMKFPSEYDYKVDRGRSIDQNEKHEKERKAYFKEKERKRKTKEKEKRKQAVERARKSEREKAAKREAKLKAKLKQRR